VRVKRLFLKAVEGGLRQKMQPLSLIRGDTDVLLLQRVKEHVWENEKVEGNVILIRIWKWEKV
jgi:hypothetical protein